MLDMLFWNGRILRRDGVFEIGHAGVKDGRIAFVEEGHPKQRLEAHRRVDLRGATLAPGLIDLHTHGADGHDAMDATSTALEGMARFAARHGVTAFLAATMTSEEPAVLAALRNIKAHMERDLGGARLLGAYVEGPFLSPACAGAHEQAMLCEPTIREVDAILETGAARAVVLAPELPGAGEAIERLTHAGIIVALGHTAASYDQMVAAAEAGATLVTHLFNAMTSLHHRKPGPVGAALTLESLTCELIADLVHIHPAVLRLALRAKGLDGVALVTDAMRGAGLPNGEYSLGGLPVVVANGSARLHDGRLAGSVLTMDQAVRNVKDVMGISLAEAWRLGSAVPARVLGLTGTKGDLAEGMDADLVVCDAEGHVQATMVAGRIVHGAVAFGGDV
ncbi:MAG: N-acetylglucosamine-6-phosphate deacetylase [Anaerolineae bacterium]